MKNTNNTPAEKHNLYEQTTITAPPLNSNLFQYQESQITKHTNSTHAKKKTKNKKNPE